MPQQDRAIRSPQPRRPAHQAPTARLTPPRMSVPPEMLYSANPHTRPCSAQSSTNPETSRHAVAGGQYESSVPVIMDRAHQARVKNALEPEREARFEPRSYGFRPGRGCQDAGSALFWTLKGKSRRVWILDADLTAAFDKISHSFLLEQLGLFPARDMIRDWLTAGVFEAGKGFAPTEEGTPQGGVISPLLLNIALHGLEEAAGVRYQGHDEARVEKDSPVLVRYADLSGRPDKSASGSPFNRSFLTSTTDVRAGHNRKSPVCLADPGTPLTCVTPLKWRPRSPLMRTPGLCRYAPGNWLCRGDCAGVVAIILSLSR